MAIRKKRSSAKSRTSGAGCLIWFFLLLVTLLLFVFNWNKIKETLKLSRFADAIGQGETEDLPEIRDITLLPAEGEQRPELPEGAEPQVKPGTLPESVPSGSEQRPNPAETSPGPVKDPKTEPVELVARTSIVNLYFIKLDDDGTLRRQEVKRSIASSDTPLTDAIKTLLEGPTVDELNRKLMSLVPSGTRLLDARVLGSTVYLDFSESFMFNNYGIEGYAGQLMQIVYTATAFSNIKDVQILIEGQKREYLAADGIYIGRPLSRSTL